LTADGPQKIADVIKCNPLHNEYRLLLGLLGKMQSLAKSSFLEPEEISNFKLWSDQYFQIMQNKFPSKSITPKCHMLVQHVSEFMDEHGFWGLFSEQSIEALHSKVNSDERRLASIRERKKILVKIVEESYVRNVV